MRTQNMIHPGEVLREEFMKPLGISKSALATALNISETRIDEIINERCEISSKEALCLGEYFKTTSEFWMNLQINYNSQIH